MDGGGGGTLSWLRRFDVYRKVEHDFTKQTRTGAAISIFAIVVMSLLFLSELSQYLTVKVESEMFVDNTSHVETFDTLFSITFPKMSCATISVDVQDDMGRHDVGVESLLRKRRYAKDGKQLDMHDPESHAGDIKLQRAEQVGEHCNVHGHLKLNKVPGNFHLSSHSAERFGHVPNSEVNFAHVIDHLSFGEILDDDDDVAQKVPADAASTFTPLNGRSADAHAENVAYEYFLRIVPTVYESLDGSRRTAFQYTFAYKEHYDEHKGHAHPPVPSALFFRYELSPISVRYKETKRSLASFLVSVCAIVGGVFTSLGLIDALIYHGNEIIRKREIGKLG